MTVACWTFGVIAVVGLSATAISKLIRHRLTVGKREGCPDCAAIERFKMTYPSLVAWCRLHGTPPGGTGEREGT